MLSLTPHSSQENQPPPEAGLRTPQALGTLTAARQPALPSAFPFSTAVFKVWAILVQLATGEKFSVGPAWALDNAYHGRFSWLPTHLSFPRDLGLALDGCCVTYLDQVSRPPPEGGSAGHTDPDQKAHQRRQRPWPGNEARTGFAKLSECRPAQASMQVRPPERVETLGKLGWWPQCR